MGQLSRSSTSKEFSTLLDSNSLVFFLAEASPGAACFGKKERDSTGTRVCTVSF